MENDEIDEAEEEGETGNFGSTPVGMKLRELVDAINEVEPDAAEIALAEMCELYPRFKELLIFPVKILLMRGQVREALQFVNSFPEDRAPELRAICLYLLEDPTWRSLAESLLDSDNPAVSVPMALLLESAAEAEANPTPVM